MTASRLWLLALVPLIYGAAWLLQAVLAWLLPLMPAPWAVLLGIAAVVANLGAAGAAALWICGRAFPD